MVIKVTATMVIIATLISIVGCLGEVPTTSRLASSTDGMEPLTTGRQCDANNVKRVALSRRYIKGVGIEIGAKHIPLPVDTSNRVLYVDLLNRTGLERKYAGNSHVANLVNVDVVDSAETLDKFENSSLDFVIGNHVLEHVPCFLCTLSTWGRVLKKGGIVFAAVPDMRRTFDRERTGPTSLQHHLDEFQRPQSAVDNLLTHAQEKNIKEAIGRPGNALDSTEAQKFLNSDYGTAFHVHTFTPESLVDVVTHAHDNIQTSFPLRLLLAARSNSNECTLILQKMVPED